MYYTYIPTNTHTHTPTHTLFLCASCNNIEKRAVAIRVNTAPMLGLTLHSFSPHHLVKFPADAVRNDVSKGLLHSGKIIFPYFLAIREACRLFIFVC